MKRLLMINFEFPPIGGGTATANYHTLKAFAQFPNMTIDMVTSKIGRGTEVSPFSENAILHQLGIKKDNIHHWKASEMGEWLIRAHKYIKKLRKDHDYDMNFCWTGWPSGFLGYAFRKQIP